MANINEIWLPVKGYEGFYEVSNCGRVMSLNYNKTKKRKLLSGFTTKRKYKRVLLSVNTNIKKHSVHRLVAMAFIPNPENKPFVNHIDGNPSNNNMDNLEWCTASENELHAYSIGLMSAVGERNGKSKLTEKQILEIRAAKGTHSEIASIYGINAATVTEIRRGNLWAHVGGEIRILRTMSKRLTSEVVMQIYNNPKKPAQISKEIGISIGIISGIKRGDKYFSITGKIKNV